MTTPSDIGAEVSVATELLVHLKRPRTSFAAYRDRRIDSYAPITRRLLDE